MTVLSQTSRIEEHAIPLAPTPDLIYDLRREGGSSDSYYTDVARFSDAVLAEVERRAGDALRQYGRYAQQILADPSRSPGEYAIELLTLGLALARYAGAAESTPAWAVTLARGLYSLRRRFPRLKPPIDGLRTAILSQFFARRIGAAASCRGSSLESLPRLIGWLHATGEFDQEALRLRNWQSYLGTLPHAQAMQRMETAADLFAWFQHEAHAALGAYTRGVPAFLASQKRNSRCREDRLLRSQQPVEYHLNMVAAEIMNRGLRADFERAPHRVVLVPTCMRGARADRCRARVSGLDITCTGCDPDCAVNRLTRRMREEGAAVYLIPHATGFSRWLDRWQNEPNVGVTAVACMLNILAGGYEMRSRGIAAQCVPLDYPGCRKHWRSEGIPTSLNVDQLVQIVGPLPR